MEVFLLNHQGQLIHRAANVKDFIKETGFKRKSVYNSTYTGQPLNSWVILSKQEMDDLGSLSAIMDECRRRDTRWLLVESSNKVKYFKHCKVAKQYKKEHNLTEASIIKASLAESFVRDEVLYKAEPNKKL